MEAFKELLGIQSDLEAAYWVIALTATFLFFIKFLLSLFGGDSGESDISDIDFADGSDISDGSEMDSETDGSLFSVDTVLSFLNGIGWIGVICYRFTHFSTGVIISITLTTGIITFFFAYFLIKNINKFESSGNTDIRNAIGNIGTVYISIPKSGEGKGQVQVELQGRLATLDAMSMNSEIKTGEKILVCAVDKRQSIILVAPYKVEDLL